MRRPLFMTPASPEQTESPDESDDDCRAAQWREAVETGNEEVVTQLLAAHPALINTVDDDSGYTSLHLAARKGQDKIVAQLLSADSIFLSVS